MDTDSTIVAIATPAGRGGIGVVRLSGPEAVAIAASMLRLAEPLAPRHATLCDLIEPTERASSFPSFEPNAGAKDGAPAERVFAAGEKIDEVVATFYPKPHSYTTDDVVEIAAHGAPVVLR